MPLDGQYRAAGQAHAGLLLVSAKAFPQDRGYTSALAALLDKHGPIHPDQIVFLARH